MKKNIFCGLAILVFLLAGCKKESPASGIEPSNSISFNIDGSLKTCNTAISALYTHTLNGYELKISGYKQQGLDTRMEMIITSINPITQGTYTDNPAAGIQVQLVYYVDNLIIVTPHISMNSSGSVVVQEINGSSVKGSFYGTLTYNTYLGSYGTNILSNGVFNVKL